MILKVLIFSSFISTAAFFCLNPYFQKRTCHKGPPNPSLYRVKTTIAECLDMCLSHYKMNCGMVQWKGSSDECTITSSHLDDSDEFGCITFAPTTYCKHSQDVSCLRHNDKGHSSERELGFEAPEEACRSICLLSFSCYSYVYNRTGNYCTHQAESESEDDYRQLTASEVSMERIENCKAERCANIRYNPGAAYRQHDSVFADSLFDCLKKIVHQQDRVSLQWDMRTSSCRIYKERLDRISRSDRLLDTIEITESEECNERSPFKDVCLRNLLNSRMRGGIELNLTETECVEFCKLIVTCAAVDWNGRERVCNFHFLNTELVIKSGWTNYQIIPCRTKSGVFVFAHFKRTSMASLNTLDQPQHNDVTVSCIECASMCSVENCLGFVCDGISGCLTRNVHNAMYVLLK